MTPKIIELQQAPVVLVELNEYYSYPDTIGIGNNETDTYIMEMSTGNCMSIGLNLIVLGTLSDLTEDLFAECVNVYEVSESINIPKMRFYQMLESEKVYMENPYARPSYHDADRNYWMLEDKWQEAQSRTIDPTRTVVLLRKEGV